MKEKVTLNKKEQRRLMVLNKVESGEMTIREAAEVLGLSIRHVMRTLAGYRREGAAALAHGNRERKPWNALNDEIRRMHRDTSFCFARLWLAMVYLKLYTMMVMAFLNALTENLNH